MAELADAEDLKSSALKRLVGSRPSPGTTTLDSIFNFLSLCPVYTVQKLLDPCVFSTLTYDSILPPLMRKPNLYVKRNLKIIGVPLGNNLTNIIPKREIFI
jgi:hypothetical protein